VTFTSSRDMWVSTQQQFMSDTQVIIEPAPEPSDVMYASLAAPPSQHYGKLFLGWCCIVLLFLAWIPLVHLLASVAVLETWEGVLPFLRSVHEKSPMLVGIMEGIVATGGLAILMGLLPSVWTTIIHTFFGPSSGAEVQRWLGKIDFTFRFIFVVLVVAIGQATLQSLQLIKQDPKSVLSLLANSMPLASHFYMGYVLVGGSAVVLELLRFMTLVTYVTSGSMEAEDRRQKSEKETYVPMGPRYSLSVSIIVIGLIFCSLCPLMAWLACIYFCIGTAVYKTLYTSAEPRQPELGGVLWAQALDQLLLGLFTYVLVMISVLEAHGSGNGMQTLCVAPALLVVAASPFVLRRFYRWESLPFDRQAEIDAAVGDGTKRVNTGAYTQEECYPESTEPENPQGD